MRKIRNMNFAREVYCGYLTLSKGENDTFKFVLVEPEDFHKQPVALVGVFVAGKLGSTLKHDTLIWTIIT